MSSEVRVNKGKTVAERDTEKSVWPGEGFAPMVPLGRFFGMSPFTLMHEFTEEMDRLFSGSGIGQTRGDGWSPAMDIQRCNGTMVIAAELPGLRREDVKVELTDHTLIIEGERKREHKEDHQGFHRWERNYGHFYRSLPLPEGANTDQVKAELRDGVLKVSVPLVETRKELRNIPIEAESKTSPVAT